MGGDMKKIVVFVMSVLILMLACKSDQQRKGKGSATNTSGKSEGVTMTFQITSKSFKNGEAIPQKYTCEGTDVSPELSWTEPPEGTVELVLICDDPDAPMGNWNHWIVYGLLPGTRGIFEGAEKLPGIQGTNDFGKTGYGGPCPPPGKPHRYYFKLYALDTKLGLSPGVRREDILKAMEGHILAEAQIMGTYSR